MTAAPRLITLPLQHPSIWPHLDLDLLGIFRVFTLGIELATLRAAALLGRYLDELGTRRQMLVIPSLGTGLPRRVPPPTRRDRHVLQRVQPIGIATPGLLRLAAERLLPQLAILRFQFLDPLCQLLDPLNGAGMHRLPKADLLAQVEVFAVPLAHFLPQLGHFGTQLASDPDPVIRNIHPNNRSEVFHDPSALPKSPNST